MPHLKQRLLFIASGIALTLLIGTIGFILIEHYPPFDAFYMSLTTISTVGYFEVRKLSLAGRVFNSFLILFGVSTMLLAVGAMTQTIIELELTQYFPKRRQKKMIDINLEITTSSAASVVSAGERRKSFNAPAPNSSFSKRMKRKPIAR
ncbi:MAG: potassium channel family protein [Bryobacteraceae bacterium]